MNMLIVYGTTEGHTRHVCQFVQHVVAEQVANATICDAAREPPDPAAYETCFIGASLHVG